MQTRRLSVVSGSPKSAASTGCRLFQENVSRSCVAVAVCLSRSAAPWGAAAAQVGGGGSQPTPGLQARHAAHPVPLRQKPPAHVSPVVHGSPSSHGALLL